MEFQKGVYKNMPKCEQKFLAYVVAIDNPLSYHLQIYFPKEIELKYMKKAKYYKYKYASQEGPSEIRESNAFVCRLNNVNTISTSDNSTKLVYQTVSASFRDKNNWVYASVGDIDSYSRILIDLYDIFTGESLISKLASLKDEGGKPVVKEYSRPKRTHNCVSSQDLDKMAIKI